MKITGYESEKIILKELGKRIKQYRISMDYTQAEPTKKQKQYEYGEKIKEKRLFP